MYNKLEADANFHRNNLVEQLQAQVSAFLKVEFITKNIPISELQTIHTIFIPTTSQDKQNCKNYYIGHGFGGSSLMCFMFIQPLISKGNVIMWEIRGMGLSGKLRQYNYEEMIQIQAFFLKAIEVMLLYYQHTNCTFICHSFSAYLLMLFINRFPTLANNHINKMILFSPIGITPKEDDYKNNIRNCSDAFYTVLSKFAWTFNLTYKSPLRTICSCCKRLLVMDRFKDISMNAEEKAVLYRIIQTFILLPDGSQNLFFKWFEPRVIPKVPLEPLFAKEPIVEILMFFGGEADWVDKKGAKRISQKFPGKLKFIDVPNCGHNIPFEITLCRQIFEKFL